MKKEDGESPRKVSEVAAVQFDPDEISERILEFIDEDSAECRVMRAISDDDDAVPWAQITIRIRGRPDREVNLGDLCGAPDQEQVWQVLKSPCEYTIDLQVTPSNILLQGIEIHNSDMAEDGSWFDIQSFLRKIKRAFFVMSVTEKYGSVEEPSCMLGVHLDPIVIAGGCHS